MLWSNWGWLEEAVENMFVIVIISLNSRSSASFSISGPVDKNHSACYGGKCVNSLLVCHSVAVIKPLHAGYTHKVSRRRRQIGRPLVGQRHISHSSAGPEERRASESSRWQLLGCDLMLRGCPWSSLQGFLTTYPLWCQAALLAVQLQPSASFCYRWRLGLLLWFLTCSVTDCLFRAHSST